MRTATLTGEGATMSTEPHLAPGAVVAVSPAGPAPERGDLPALVAAAIGGDEQAWNGLVERFAPLVTTVVRRFRLTPADADDVRQNVWLRLVEHLADLREPRALPGWIVTTTRREAMRMAARDRSVDIVDPQADDRLEVVDRRDVATGLLRRESGRGRAGRTGRAANPAARPAAADRRRTGCPVPADQPAAGHSHGEHRADPCRAPCASSRTLSRCAPWRADHNPAIRSVSVMPGPCPSRMYHSVPNE